MFIIPCKFDSNSLILECIQSIQKFYPNEKIVVVDSCSDDKSYFEYVKPEVYDIIEGNANYEIGAYLMAYNKYSNEEKYFCIHDSLIMTGKINDFDLNKLLITVQWFNGFWDDEAQRQFAENVIGKTLANSRFIGCFGSIMICDNIVLNKLQHFLKPQYLPKNKKESCAFERILGILLGNVLGLNMTNSLQGQHITIEHKYNEAFCKKIFMKRA